MSPVGRALALALLACAARAQEPVTDPRAALSEQAAMNATCTVDDALTSVNRSVKFLLAKQNPMELPLTEQTTAFA